MSPSGKAPDFDSGIRRFKSCHPSQSSTSESRLLAENESPASAVRHDCLKYHQYSCAFMPSSKAVSSILRTTPGFRGFADSLAQLAEQLPFKQWVWSSNLQRVTNKRRPHPNGCGLLLFAARCRDSNSGRSHGDSHNPLGNMAQAIKKGRSLTARKIIISSKRPGSGASAWGISPVCRPACPNSAPPCSGRTDGRSCTRDPPAPCRDRCC